MDDLCHLISAWLNSGWFYVLVFGVNLNFIPDCKLQETRVFYFFRNGCWENDGNVNDDDDDCS